ncbi:MAG: LytR/AlgR family response regulator transcription factor [Lachnospiraceae bacterium]
MLIGILDDDRFWCEKARTVLKKYAKVVGKEMDIKTFLSKEDLMEYKEDPLDVVFMDIVLEPEASGEKNETGIDIAAVINDKWKNCQIVYLTNYLYYATDVYNTKHTYFVLKEQFEKRIPDVFEKIFHKMGQKQKKYTFTLIGGKDVALAPEDIHYFERRNRVTRIETVWGTYETWEKIGDIYERLEKLDFVRCHNSFIIYLPVIRELMSEEAILDDDTKIYISRNYRKSVKQAFARWALTQMP